MPDGYTTLKSHFWWFTLGSMIKSWVMRMLWEHQNKNSDLHLAYWNHDTVEIVNYTKKMVVKFNYVL